jgi:hypothetical protein
MSHFYLNPFSRVIAHIDGDAFFASVEQAVEPRLRGRPVVTGKERGIASSMLLMRHPENADTPPGVIPCGASVTFRGHRGFSEHWQTQPIIATGQPHGRCYVQRQAVQSCVTIGDHYDRTAQLHRRSKREKRR